jgi:hypothetical protein
MITDFIITKGIVVDNNHPDQKSYLKVKILPFMENVTNDLLPWIAPFSNDVNSADGIGTHLIPENNSLVRVLIEMPWEKQKFYYLQGENIVGFNIYDQWQSIESKMSELTAATYPQPNQFSIYPDGSCFFRNTENGACGWFNSNENYMIWEANGNLIINGKTKDIKLYNENVEIELKNSTKTIKLKSGSSTIITVDGNTNFFKLEDGTNTITSSASGLDLNSHLTITP